MTNGENNNHWHLDKRVSVGHIVTTLVVVTGFVVWLLTLESRVAVNATAINNIKQFDAAHEVRAAAEMSKLEAKMDAQTRRLEGRMEAQYNEIIRRLEILDQRMIDNNRSDARNHTQ